MHCERGTDMKRYNRITPEGTRDLLFRESNERKKVMATLRSIFEDAGYNYVITPGFEFYDVFSSSELYFPQESMYKLVDDKGRILVARPDSTIPIARLVATKLKGFPLPLRLCYEQTIFRKNPGLSGRNDETMQSGVELIGDSSFNSDIEILKLGVKALSACQKKNLRIEIGHVGIFKLLMENIEASDDQKAAIHEFIAAKNYAALSSKLDKLKNDRTTALLKELPKLFGGKEVIAKAEKIFSDYDVRITEMIEYLKKIFCELKKRGFEEYVIIDFGLVNQAEYYSSLVFRGYIEAVGAPVLSGGRYDRLLRDFGYDQPATGFAINVDLLTYSALKEEENSRVTDNGNLRIALTKGRLEKDAIKLFKAMGFDCKNLEEKGRKLLVSIPNQDIDVLFAKAADVITYVEHGVCDLGIVGMDTIMEKGGTFYEVLNLGFGKCKFSLAAPKGVDFYSGYSTKRISTKYPKVTRDFFEEKGMDVEIIKIEGSVELAPILSLADAIVDIVETGKTLKENGLEIIEDIQELSARLIVNEASMKMKKDKIDSLIEKMDRAVNG
ncbi:MAG: ATP phosphoribosyltransferase regulatory subunit [Clostridiales bacterium]|nr:ATP phosphoribosyltransferase regulatory subunit [Clostridiales bacterium]